MKIAIPLMHHVEERTMEELNAYFRPEVFIEYCKSCKYYSKIWTCPPYYFDIPGLLEDFQYAYIIGSKLYFNGLDRSLKTITDQENAEQAFNEIYEAARAVLDEKLIDLGHGHILALLAGRCLNCSPCTREKQLPCTYPDKAHYSLESLGYDVSAICEDILGDKIQWSKNGLPEYLTLVSAVLSRKKLDIRDIYSLIS